MNTKAYEDNPDLFSGSMMNSKSLPSISISCIETRSYEQASRAVVQTLKACGGLPIKRVYWFSDVQYPRRSEFENHWGDGLLKWVEIKPFDTERSFNRQLEDLTLRLLPETVDTDFNLVIQADGYAVNRDAWTDDFFQYDYIGASWPWEVDGSDVGNGGFSWRSKKLYQAILDLRGKYSLAEMIASLPKVGVIRDKFQGEYIPEDNLICKVYRPLLEKQYGIRFAPAQLADQFSVETNSASPWFGRSFGFHGHLTGSFYINK